MTADRQRSAPAQKEPGEALDLMLRAATLLFANGQTTERVMEATARLGGAFGFLADLLPRWGELTATVDDGDGSRAATVVANPLGVDMRKVAATMDLIDRFCDGRIAAGTAGTSRIAGRGRRRRARRDFRGGASAQSRSDRAQRRCRGGGQAMAGGDQYEPLRAALLRRSAGRRGRCCRGPFPA